MIIFQSYLFTLPGGDPQHLCVVVVQQNAGHTSKHLLEMLLEFGHVLAVTNDLKQIFITNEIEPDGEKKKELK